jgi:hypothetical protein
MTREFILGLQGLSRVLWVWGLKVQVWVFTGLGVYEFEGAGVQGCGLGGLRF